MEKKTLKQRMREDLQLRGFSPHTQKEYLMRVTLFARYFKRLPDKLGEKEVKEYFLHLVRGTQHDLLRPQVYLHGHPRAAPRSLHQQSMRPRTRANIKETTHIY